MNEQREMPRRRARGGVSRRQQAAQNSKSQSALAHQIPYQLVVNSMVPLNPLSDDHIEAIHHASLQVISTMGVKVLSASARQHLREQGCMVDDDTEIVRMDPQFVTDMVAKAPSEFTLTPRNPDHALHIGGNKLNFGLVSGPPNAHDAINGRRAGTIEDFKSLVKLGQSFNCIHFMGNQAVATTDLPANTRHLDRFMSP